MTTLKCLRCGHEWTPYKAKTSLSWRQCPNPECRSYSILEAKLFETIVEDVLKQRNPHSRRVFPILDTIIAILDNRGITLRPRQTLDLARAVEKEVIKRLGNL